MNARTPGLPGEPPTVLEGKQRVDGFEFGATGRITRAWDIIASYTYLDSEDRESNTPTEVGNRLANVPVHSGSLVDDLQIAGRRRGRRRRPLRRRSASPTSPTRARSRAMSSPTPPRAMTSPATSRCALNAFNLFDKRFADQIGGGHFIPGPGRSVLATLSIRR